uniref:STAS domain-containing protein n=1 Tax=Heterorhabditis bacteriophora TaxID=37862 RepID=A0A1I7X3V7_HETBA
MFGRHYITQGICMFRFDSPLLFTNVERFKRTVNKAYRRWERSHEFYVLGKERSQLLLDPSLLTDNEKTVSINSSGESLKTNISFAFSSENDILSRHFIIDCSGFTFVDYMGVSTLKEVYSEMRNRGILVYFAAAKAPVRDLFESSGFYSFVAKENFYPTIRDAVAIARRRQLALVIFNYSTGKDSTTLSILLNMIDYQKSLAHIQCID